MTRVTLEINPLLSISHNGKTDLIIANGYLRYRDEILLHHALAYASAIANGLQLYDANARPHPGHEANEFLDKNISDRMQLPSKIPILNESCECPYERLH